MDSFEACRKFESDCWHKCLRKFVASISESHIRFTGVGRRSVEQQKAGGSDLCIRQKGGEEKYVEVKCERRFTGNLFLETWSNKAFEKGIQKAGWMSTSTSDVLLYYFDDSGRLFNIDMKRLQLWFFGDGDKQGSLGRYTEVEQKKSSQLNRTFGRLVRIEDIATEVGLIEYRLGDDGFSVVRDTRNRPSPSHHSRTEDIAKSVQGTLFDAEASLDAVRN